MQIHEAIDWNTIAYVGGCSGHGRMFGAWKDENPVPSDESPQEPMKLASGESWQTSVVKNQLKKDGYWDDAKPAAPAKAPDAGYSTGKSDRQIREQRPDVQK